VFWVLLEKKTGGGGGVGEVIRFFLRCLGKGVGASGKEGVAWYRRKIGRIGRVNLREAVRKGGESGGAMKSLFAREKKELRGEGV